MNVVNVASVPQYSPFRYAGGKSWLVPYIRAWLASLPKPSHFIDAFAGGGSVGLAVAFENLAGAVWLNEIDRDVSAVWSACVFDRYGRLPRLIREFDMTHANLAAALATPDPDRIGLAFQTILRNRTNFSGILAPGVGTTRDVKARWYPETVARRIEAINAMNGVISPRSQDALSLMRQARLNAGFTTWFIDPPYTAGNGKRAGRRLYTHNEVDHDELFKLAADLHGDFLMTYDDDPDVVDLAIKHGFEVEPVPMKSNHHRVVNELLIGNELTWLRDFKQRSSLSSAA